MTGRCDWDIQRNIAENLETSKKRGRTAGMRGPPLSSNVQHGDNRTSSIAELAVGHFLGHVEDELAIPFFHFAQQAAKLVEKACIFTDAAPGDVVRRFTLGKIRQLRRFMPVLKELIEGPLEDASELFQRFDNCDRMAICNSGKATTKQPLSTF